MSTAYSNLFLRVPTELKDAIAKAAESAGMKMNPWAVAVLSAASGDAPPPPKRKKLSDMTAAERAAFRKGRP